jgi:hypothetical protein
LINGGLIEASRPSSSRRRGSRIPPLIIALLAVRLRRD